MSETYDFIVIGGGTGGSMVASKLTKQFPKDDILLIEEGSYSSMHPSIDNLGLWRTLFGDKTIQRCYQTTPQSGLNNRVIDLPRAK